MPASAEYIEYIRDLFSGFSDLSVKKYFGGIAFRSDQLGQDTQFAVVLTDELYFVVDDQTRSRYIDKGMEPFRYDKKTGTVEVKKWYTAPEELFDDEELMMEWALQALEAAVRQRK